MALIIYTDGACVPNPGRGGWAYVIPSLGIEKSGGNPQTTNNHMELMAIHEALKDRDDPDILLYTDSQYCIGVCQLGWKAKANIGPVQTIRSLMSGRRVTLRWVRGHDGNHHNERADRLAGLAAFDGDLDALVREVDTFDAKVRGWKEHKRRQAQSRSGWR